MRLRHKLGCRQSHRRFVELYGRSRLHTVESLEARRLLSAVYSIIDIGTLSGGTYSTAYGVNAQGQVIGVADTAIAGFHPFIYSNGRIKDLLPGDERLGEPRAINNAGQVVGYVLENLGDFVHPNYLYSAFLYANGTTQVFLDNAVAADINEAGRIVGTIVPRAFEDDYDVFLYDGEKTQRIVKRIEYNDFGQDVRIGENGQVVGSVRSSDGTTTTYSVFLYGDGVTRYLGIRGLAHEINSAGQFVGELYPENGLRHAFLYDHGVVRDLTPSSSDHTYAFGINNEGVAVGYRYNSRSQHAYSALLYKNGDAEAL